MKGLRKLFFALSVTLLIGIFTFSQVSYATKFVDDLRTKRAPETLRDEIEGLFSAVTKGISIGRDCTVSVRLLERPFLLGEEPDAQSPIVSKVTLDTDAAIAIAAGLKSEGWIGRASPTTIDTLGNAERQAKDLGKKMDQRAHQLQIDIIAASGKRAHIMGSEGESDGLAPEDLFKAGQVVNPTGTEGDIFMISDEVDATTNTVTDNNRIPFEQLDPWSPGGISLQATGEIIQKRGLGSDSFYKAGLFFNVPAEKRQGFIDNPIDPDIDDVNFEAAEDHVRQALTRIAEANGKSLKDVEVVLMKRGREKYKKRVLDSLGVEWHDFTDGTPGHAALANLKPDTGKVRVFWTVMKSTEGGWNEAVADALYQAGYGAIAYTKIYSEEINYADDNIGAKSNERAKSTNMTRRFVWTDAVRQEITQKYPKDYEAILAGTRIFVTGQVTGTLDATMTLATDNRLFNQRGIGELQPDGTIEVPMLRVRAVQEGEKWKCYTSIESRKVDYRTYCLMGLINAPEERVASWMLKFNVNRASISPEEKEQLGLLLALKQKRQDTVRGRKIDSVIDGVIQGRLTLTLNLNKTEIENVFVRATSVPELMENLKGVLEFSPTGDLEVRDEAKLRAETIDYLAREAALNPNRDVKEAAQYLIREAALSLGIIPASIQDLYKAREAGRWGGMTVPAVNLRAGVGDDANVFYRVVRDMEVGPAIMELARSEIRYTYQRPGEYTAMGFAAAIKQGHKGLVFFMGDHYQVNKDKYMAGGEAREQELQAFKNLIRESILAGEFQIDLDPSNLVDQDKLTEILKIENGAVDAYLKKHPELTVDSEGRPLDKPGMDALRSNLVDNLDNLELDEEWQAQVAKLDGLYEEMHRIPAEVTMYFIRYIRELQRELLGDRITIAIGAEERHIDKEIPSTVRGTRILRSMILPACEEEGLVPPVKYALQTGPMHGVGGDIDMGVFKRHKESIPNILAVQHGTSKIKKREDFAELPGAGVAEAHLATKYQDLRLGITALMMPELAERMAIYLEGLIAAKPDDYGKFAKRWANAFNDPVQQGKTRSQIIAEILGDELPQNGKLIEKDKPIKLRGTLKDLVKELSGPFKHEIWNTPEEVNRAIMDAQYQELLFVFTSLKANNTRGLLEGFLPADAQAVIHGQRPEALAVGTRLASGQTLGEAKPSLFAENMVGTIVLPASLALDAAQATNVSNFINAGSDGKYVIILGADENEIDTARAGLADAGLSLEGIEGERLFFAFSNNDDLLSAVQELFRQNQENFTLCTGDNLSAAVRRSLEGAI